MMNLLPLIAERHHVAAVHHRFHQFLHICLYALILPFRRVWEDTYLDLFLQFVIGRVLDKFAALHLVRLLVSKLWI